MSELSRPLDPIKAIAEEIEKASKLYSLLTRMFLRYPNITLTEELLQVWVDDLLSQEFSDVEYALNELTKKTDSAHCPSMGQVLAICNSRKTVRYERSQAQKIQRDRDNTIKATPEEIKLSKENAKQWAAMRLAINKPDPHAEVRAANNLKALREANEGYDKRD